MRINNNKKVSDDQKEIENIVNIYKNGAPPERLSPDEIVVIAAAMELPAGATPEQRQVFENMRRIAMGMIDAKHAGER